MMGAEAKNAVCTAVVLAAGRGTRMGISQAKQYLEIGGKPVLAYALEAFQQSPAIDGIVLVTDRDHMEYCRTEIVEPYGIRKVSVYAEGGRERYESVWNALKAIAPTPDRQYVFIHDGARPFATRELCLPDEDGAADLYLAAAGALEARGYAQYEISNFSRPGRESRHNLKYWDLQPYLGIGPAAHSLLSGRRFAYPRDTAAFLRGEAPVSEQPAGREAAIRENSPEEYLMLRLRLTAGLRADGFAARFGFPLPARWRQRAARLPAALVTADAEGIRLTREGFLVSNAVIARLLDDE